jgi:hypothetical protein
MFRSRIVMVSALLITVLTSTEASAITGHASKYGGGQCQATSGSRTISSGRAYNPSVGSSATWMCPIVNGSICDNAFCGYDEQSIDPENSWVQVIDNNSTSGQHVTCTLYASYMTDTYEWAGYGPYAWSSTVSTSSLGTTYSSNAPTHLYFAGSFGSGNDVYHYMTCSVPPFGAGSSFVVSYSTWES